MSPRGLPPPVVRTELDGLPTPRRGKVRDVYDLGELDFCGLGSRGTKICSKPVKSIVLARGG